MQSAGCRCETVCAPAGSARSARASHVPRVKKNWLSCAPIDTVGTIGTPASMAVVTYPHRTPKLMTFSWRVGR